MHKRKIRPGILPALVLALVCSAAVSSRGAGQAGAPTTGKERLSDKASDEQRVDNCRVPVDRRGTKPRPGCKSPDMGAEHPPPGK